MCGGNRERRVDQIFTLKPGWNEECGFSSRWKEVTINVLRIDQARAMSNIIATRDSRVADRAGDPALAGATP